MKFWPSLFTFFSGIFSWVYGWAQNANKNNSLRRNQANRQNQQNGSNSNRSHSMFTGSNSLFGDSSFSELAYAAISQLIDSVHGLLSKTNLKGLFSGKSAYIKLDKALQNENIVSSEPTEEQSLSDLDNYVELASNGSRQSNDSIRTVRSVSSNSSLDTSLSSILHSADNHNLPIDETSDSINSTLKSDLISNTSSNKFNSMRTMRPKIITDTSSNTSVESSNSMVVNNSSYETDSNSSNVSYNSMVVASTVSNGTLSSADSAPMIIKSSGDDASLAFLQSTPLLLNEDSSQNNTSSDFTPAFLQAPPILADGDFDASLLAIANKNSDGEKNAFLNNVGNKDNKLEISLNKKITQIVCAMLDQDPKNPGKDVIKISEKLIGTPGVDKMFKDGIPTSSEIFKVYHNGKVDSGNAAPERPLISDTFKSPGSNNN